MGREPAKYWAFISYSHRDTRAAIALQRGLETYRLPSRLVGKRTAMGEVPAYVKPVFRDRDELEAGTDLRATVREALAHSRWLVVLCSPDSARSPWVNREIVEFKKLHGEASVLACIASGEPFASRIPGRETEECFPQALRYTLAADGEPTGEETEPVAADLRPQGDGRRRALLKLVAGMVGIGVDELINRDAHRRARRMAMLATASLAGMAVMAVLTVMAVQSRIEAQSQRAQAEDLIEFMLGDLRKKLDAVGRLDALDSVGAKALAYYAKQDAGRLDADALGRRSRAMHLIGELREKRGHLVEALAAFQSAAETTAQLLARSPNDGNRIFDHAQSVFWVGYIAWLRGQAKEAEEAFLQYRGFALRLVQIGPQNIDWQLEPAYASQNLGVVLLDQLRPAEALKAFVEAKDVKARLVAARPHLLNDVADSFGWFAKAHEAAGDYASAVSAQGERIALLQAKVDLAKDRGAQQHLANANFELGRLHLNLGDLAAAERHARIALEQADALSASDPANMFWLSQSSFHRLSIAEVQLALGRRDEARHAVERVMREIARLVTSDASKVAWQLKLQGRALALGARLALADGHEPSTRELENYLAVAHGFESPEKRLKPDEASAVAVVELLLGDALLRRGMPDAARGHWQSAARRLDAFAGQADYRAQTQLARLQLRLGQRTASEAIATRIRSSVYRHPAYAELANELRSEAGVRLVQLNRREGSHAIRNGQR